jgi:RNase P subunit RPR2
MGTSIFAEPLTAVSLIAAVIAALLLVHYLVRKPPFNTVTKLLLLAGLGVFPILSAGSGNYAGFEQTTKREFCNGCHVMRPWVADSEDPASTSLAALHARNELFGDRNCYTCHADYGMFGTAATKIGGMRHVYYYVTAYHDMPIARFVEEIRIRRPFPNSTCTHCHSTLLPGWQQVPDHKAMQDPEAVSCASKGCHGPAHPFAGAAR